MTMKESVIGFGNELGLEQFPDINSGMSLRISDLNSKLQTNAIIFHYITHYT